MELTDYERSMKQALIDYPPKHFDNNGFCKHCGWCCSYMESHVEHNPSCKFIKKKFNISRDEDGELVWYAKIKKIKKTKKVQSNYTFY
jgi:hypothetical protein